MLRSNPRRARERREKAGLADPGYLSWLHTQRCALHGGGCRGPLEANHHTSGRGLGQKADDKRSFTLCREHHAQMHEYRGFFAGWGKDQRRAWQTAQVERYRALYQSSKASIIDSGGSTGGPTTSLL